jgi:ATPase subunit of ABC transporter with duplicated ATPase domains
MAVLEDDRKFLDNNTSWIILKETDGVRNITYREKEREKEKEKKRKRRRKKRKRKGGGGTERKRQKN